MALRITAPSRSKLTIPIGVIQLKRKILSFNQAAVNDFRIHYSGDPQHCQILLDDERPNLLWIRLCDAKDRGVRNLFNTSKNSKQVAIGSIFLERHQIMSELAKVTRFNLKWDKQAEAFVLDLFNGTPK